MAKQFINSNYKMKGIATIELAFLIDRLNSIANDVENETGEVDLAKDIRRAAHYLEKQSTDLIVEENNDLLGEIDRVYTLLLKGDDYEIACPDNEDVWYDLSSIQDSKYRQDLERIIGEETMQLLADGKIDYVACRGCW